MALHLVTVHHEGAGTPSDIARGAGGGYTYWVGAHGWLRLRSPYVSYATLNFNHVSVDVCLSGDRDVSPLTNEDIIFLSQIAADARGRGELVGNPMVRPHRWSPGSSTVCPGTNTMDRWHDVERCFSGVAPAPGPAPAPAPAGSKHPTLAPGTWGPAVTRLQHELNVGALLHLAEDGAFGHHTLQAVCGFQAFFHLDVDGIVGPKTWTMVDYCYHVRGGR